MSTPEALDKIADIVLRYRPKPKSKPAKKRARRKKKIQDDSQTNRVGVSVGSNGTGGSTDIEAVSDTDAYGFLQAHSDDSDAQESISNSIQHEIEGGHVGAKATTKQQLFALR